VNEYGSIQLQEKTDMYMAVIILHILVCFVLCVVVLLQSSKGGGLAGAFGGAGAPQQIFGARGMTTLLHKLTIYCAIGFFLTSTTLFGLTANRGGGGGSIVQDAVSEGTLTSDVAQPTPTDGALFPSFPSEDSQATGTEQGTEPVQPIPGDEASSQEANEDDSGSGVLEEDTGNSGK
jgi:preprotein translocase subunit SecG